MGNCDIQELLLNYFLNRTDMTDEGMLSLGKGIEKLVHLENLHFEIAAGYKKLDYSFF